MISVCRWRTANTPTSSECGSSSHRSQMKRAAVRHGIIDYNSQRLHQREHPDSRRLIPKRWNDGARHGRSNRGMQRPATKSHSSNCNTAHCTSHNAKPRQWISAARAGHAPRTNNIYVNAMSCSTNTGPTYYNWRWLQVCRHRRMYQPSY